MQTFDEEGTSLKPRKEEVCKDFYRTRKTKNNEWLKKLLSKKPLTPWTMVFPDPPPQSCPWGSANSLLFLTLYSYSLISLSLDWPVPLQAASHCTMGFRDCRGIKTVHTFCLYSPDPGSWLVTFTISIDQNISETALFSISVISHKYLTIHLKHNQDPGHKPGPGC